MSTQSGCLQCFLPTLPVACPWATAFSTSCFRLGASQAPFHDHGVPASPPSEAAPGALALLPLGAQGTGAEPVLHGEWPQTDQAIAPLKAGVGGWGGVAAVGQVRTPHWGAGVMNGGVGGHR